MGLFGNTSLSKEQLSQIMRDTGCTKSDARKLAKMAAEKGMASDELLSSGLYRLSFDDLKRYLEKPSPRRFVDVVVQRDKVSAYEVYVQMMRAKNEFDVPYASFVKKGLLNASDGSLTAAGHRYQGKQDRSVSRIARAQGISEKEAQELVNHIREEFGYSAHSIYVNRLYLKSDEEIEAFRDRARAGRAKIEKAVAEKTGWSIEQARTHISHCAADFGMDTALYFACRCYTLSDEQMELCGTMQDSKDLSARYNRGNAKYLYDKQLFDEAYGDFMGRKFWVNRDTDFDAFAAFAEGVEEAFCKPLDSSIGRGTFKKSLKNDAGEPLNEAELHGLYEWFLEQPPLLAEESIIQHPEMAKFYPEALNTVRLFTILHEDTFDPFASFVRFGVKGITDNFSTGGIACGVDPRTGMIVTSGVSKDGTRYEEHPVTGEKFVGFQIPHWDMVIEKAEAGLRTVEGVNYVGWDIAIRKDDVVFVEGNSTPDLGIQQALFVDQGVFIKQDYIKYLEDGGYENMRQKIAFVVEKTGCSRNRARILLATAARSGLSYEFVVEQEIYRLNLQQIKYYAQINKDHFFINAVAKKNNLTIAEAYLQMRDAKVKHGIQYGRYAVEELYGKSDEELAALA